jgi:hypothetical protein
MKTFKTPNGTISVDPETHNGNPLIWIDNVDDDKSASIMLDNHQAYQLAMTLLASIDVVDTRGGR